MLKFCALVLIIISAALLSSSASYVDAVANLIEIQGEDKFTEWTVDDAHGRTTLVYFYAPWSPLCKEFTKQYKEVAKHFGQKEYQEHVMITKIDGPNYPRLSRSLGIESFPTIYLYSHKKLGEYEKYDGEFDKDSVIEWTEKRIHKKLKKQGLPLPKKKFKRDII